VLINRPCTSKDLCRWAKHEDEYLIYDNTVHEKEWPSCNGIMTTAKWWPERHILVLHWRGIDACCR